MHRVWGGNVVTWACLVDGCEVGISWVGKYGVGNSVVGYRGERRNCGVMLCGMENCGGGSSGGEGGEWCADGQWWVGAGTLLSWLVYPSMVVNIQRDEPHCHICVTTAG